MDNGIFYEEVADGDLRYKPRNGGEIDLRAAVTDSLVQIRQFPGSEIEMEGAVPVSSRSGSACRLLNVELPLEGKRARIECTISCYGGEEHINEFARVYKEVGVKAKAVREALKGFIKDAFIARMFAMMAMDDKQGKALQGELLDFLNKYQPLLEK